MANLYSWNNPWQNYGRYFGKNYDDMMSTNLSMKHEPNPYVPTVDKIGRTVLSGLYAGIKSGFDSDKPSAVIGSSGIKSSSESSDMPARGRGRGRRQPMSKKAKVARKRAQLRKGGLQYSKAGLTKYTRSNANFKPSGRSRFGKQIVVSAPSATGTRYGGSKIMLRPSTRMNMNCTKMATRTYLGTVQLLTTSGATNIMTSQTCGCSWFFQPTNQYYWPTGAPITNMARMYQYYFLNNVSIELESSYQPGNSVPYKTYFTSFDDPNIGESYITAYDSVGQVTPTQILLFPNSRSFPTWEPKVVIPIPRRYYNSKKYVCRSSQLNSKIITSSQSDVATNKQEIPFGFFINISGATPSSTLTMYDLFVSFDVEFCDLAPTQLFNATGGTASLSTTESSTSKVSDTKESSFTHSINEEFELLPTSTQIETLTHELDLLRLRQHAENNDETKSRKGSRK